MSNQVANHIELEDYEKAVSNRLGAVENENIKLKLMLSTKDRIIQEQSEELDLLKGLGNLTEKEVE